MMMMMNWRRNNKGFDGGQEGRREECEWYDQQQKDKSYWPCRPIGLA